MKKSELFFNTLLLPFDFLMIVVAGLATYFFRIRILSSFRPVFFELNLPFEKYFLLVLLAAVLFVAVFALSGLYSLRTTTSRIEEFFRIAIASSAGIMSLIVYIFLRQELFNSRFLVLGGWILTVLFVSLGRFFIRNLQKNLVARYDFGIHKVMVIGGDNVSAKVIGEIRKNPSIGYRVVKHLENPEVAEVKSAIGNPGIDEIILANPNFPSGKVLEIIDFCNENHLSFKYVPNIHQVLTTNFSVDVLAGVPVIELRRTNLDGWGKVIKRTVDVLGSILALAIFSPLLLVIAFAIKWETDGPVLVRLRRVSRNREFYLFKFRSMVKNAEELKLFLKEWNERRDGPLFKMRRDPRVTGIGKFIRRYRLDELPQLVNVLKGDISLVGPRPHQPDEIANYEKRHKKVLSIKAGVTGLAQVSGSSDLPFEEEVALDSFYIENWSLTQDLKILLKTIIKMIFDRSAV